MENSDDFAFKERVLEYWTLVEFFSPYSLERVLSDKRSYQRLFAGDEGPLPWEKRLPLDREDPASPYEKGYNLYLGLFNTEETADRARHVFCKEPSPWQSIDWRQCGAASTASCFARVTLSLYGTPFWGTLSLSTLPWAHGQLLNGDASTLKMESFWKGVHRLLLELKERFAETLPRQLVREPKECAATLNSQAIGKLVEILFLFAGYAPRGYPLALIEPLPSSLPSEKSHPGRLEEGQNGEEANIPSDCGEISLERQVPILNSFYILDLERAKASLKGMRGSALDRYLGGKLKSRLHLESEEGRKKILSALKPSNLPKGRWPSCSTNSLSMMQQFAANQLLASLAEGGIFSVNGPPGTGKTTLLREIIAHNIVARAEALAEFHSAREALPEKVAIGFSGGDQVFASTLHPSLLGYEMLLTSSNNAAVENLSAEMPLKRQLAPAYSGASYLRSVSERLLGGEEAWGLISAAVGKVENCKKLVEKLFISREEGKGGERIWEWVDRYDGPTFHEAKGSFLSIKERRLKVLNELEELALLHGELSEKSSLSRDGELYRELECAENKVDSQAERLKSLRDEEEEAKGLLELLERRAELFKRERPSIASRLLKGKEWSSWSEQESLNTREQISALEELHRRKSAVSEAKKKLVECEEELESIEYKLLERSTWIDWCRGEYQRLRAHYPEVSLPGEEGDIDDPELQKGCFYQSQALNGLSTELFLAALALHEAWLAETLRRRGGFRGNLMAISLLLQGKQPTTADDTRLAFQSLFLLIPLISSTFASIGRLFRYLEPESIGWMFIDEAGQALPQAAVGAIWRAKRVLSIGDPFQIEPISQIAPEIVDGMAKSRLNDKCLSFAPSRTSVQNLMDSASEYGTKRHIHDYAHWLGAPLRVHRRCMEPMFSIANEIAYEKSMVLATPSKELGPFPESCWYDIAGPVAGRQYVPLQGSYLIKALGEALLAVESADLYVISPFREIVQKLKMLVLQESGLKKIFQAKFPERPLSDWARESIGTVHSFQGKQAGSVFFVLGGDATTLGSIEWASRKPNLLNVAVTRAKNRFYVIGDYDLWRKWPYFETAARYLKRVSVK